MPRIRRTPFPTYVPLLALLITACSSTPSRTPAPTTPGEGSASAAFAPLETGAPDAPPADGPRLGPSQIRVIWEALAVERDQLENPRHGRRPSRGVIPTQKIVLVSESHPEAKANLMGRSAREHQGIAVAALPDRDMLLLMRGLEQRGFFRIAKPTFQAESGFANPNARGRVTVERGMESMTLVSMRGQGLNDATDEIPALYSEVKRSIIVLRNQTPTMSVVTSGRQPLR